MKNNQLKRILPIVFIWLISQIPISTYAQEKNNFQVEFNVLSHFMLIDYGTGWGYGGNIKFLLPKRSNSNYITVAANYDRLWEKFALYNNHIKYYYNLVSVTTGYRKMINNFYVEPQVGLGDFLKEDIAVIVGVEPGLYKNNVSLSFNYRYVLMGGFFMGESVHVFSLKAGFRLRKNE